jgi:pimeloyl-ACP methyl ester carboxylesterase
MPAGRTDLDTGNLRGWVRSNGPRGVLLLHGGPGICYDYLDALLPELDGWTMACFQQRGLAPSTLEGPFDVSTAVADIESVLDVLGWDDAYLLGHSWGGHLGLHAACRLGRRVAGVLAVDPLGVVGDGGEEQFEAELLRRVPPEVRARVIELEDSEDEAEADEELRLLWPAYFANPAAAPPFVSLPLSQAAFLGLWADQEVQRPSLEAALPSLTVPLGIVMGAESPMPRSAGSDVVDLVPGAWLDVVSHAGTAGLG